MQPEQLAPIVVFSLLLSTGLYFVLRPLSAAGARRRARQEGQRLRLLEEKQSLVQLLREIEFDRRTGKLSPEDYESSRAEAESRALEVMQELDAQETAWTEERIEQEIARMRRRLHGGRHA